MIEKDKALPLVMRSGGFYTTPIWDKGWDAGVVAQRDADWERVKVLVEAAVSFLRKEALAGIYGLAFAHGVQYDGPNYNEERKALVKALAQLGVKEASDD